MKSVSIRSIKPDRKTPEPQQQTTGPSAQKPYMLPLSPCDDLHVLIANGPMSSMVNGVPHGSALDDWLDAEREILSQIPPTSHAQRARLARQARSEVRSSWFDVPKTSNLEPSLVPPVSRANIVFPHPASPHYSSALLLQSPILCYDEPPASGLARGSATSRRTVMKSGLEEFRFDHVQDLACRVV